MGFIREVAKEVIVDTAIGGALGVAASAAGAIDNKLEEGARKKEIKNKDKLAKVAKKSKYTNCELLSFEENNGLPKYEIRDANAQIEFASSTQKGITIIQDFQGNNVAAVVSDKIVKKGMFSKASFHQILHLRLNNQDCGFVETNYSNDIQTIKASIGDWNLWFSFNEKLYKIDEQFSISPQKKAFKTNYLLEYNDETKRLAVIVMAVGIMEAKRQIKRAK